MKDELEKQPEKVHGLPQNEHKMSMIHSVAANKLFEVVFLPQNETFRTNFHSVSQHLRERFEGCGMRQAFLSGKARRMRRSRIRIARESRPAIEKVNRKSDC